MHSYLRRIFCFLMKQRVRVHIIIYLSVNKTLDTVHDIIADNVRIFHTLNIVLTSKQRNMWQALLFLSFLLLVSDSGKNLKDLNNTKRLPGICCN